MDHASDDGSADEIRSAFPDLEIVQLEENHGPTAGMNRVLQTLLAREVDALFVLPHDLELAPELRGLIDFCRGRWGPPPP